MSLFDAGITAYILFCAFVFGTILGSAMNCLALRTVHHEKWGGKSRSKCPSCGHVLGPLDLIPVVSYIALGGKCRYCKKKISPRYLIAEVILGIAFVLLTVKSLGDISSLCDFYFTSGTLYDSFRMDLIGEVACLTVNLIFASCVFALSLADMDSFEIPDRFILIPAICRLLYVLLFGADTKILGNGCGILNSGVWTDGLLSLADTLVSGVAVGAAFIILSLVMDKVLNKDSLGGGDIKLFAMAGLYLRLPVMLVCVFLACVIGLITAVVSMKRADKAPAQEDTDEIPEGAFPFGPAISMSAFICILYGEKILSAYLGLIGLG